MYKVLEKTIRRTMNGERTGQIWAQRDGLGEAGIIKGL